MADCYSSDSDHDDALDQDIDALRRACILTGATPPPPNPGEDVVTDDVFDDDVFYDDEDDGDDVGILQRMQNRFAVDTLPMVEPLCTKMTGEEEEEEEDDFETLRVIRRRLAQYQSDDGKKKIEATLQGYDGIIPDGLHSQETPNISQSNDQSMMLTEDQASSYVESHDVREEAYSTNVKDLVPSKFPESALNFVAALKKNRAMQKFIRKKMLEIEARKENIKELCKRLKCLIDCESGCKKRIGSILTQNKDLRIKLIATQKPRIENLKTKWKRFPALCYGPVENAHAPNYRMALERFPFSLTKKHWTNEERVNLVKGIKQQYQEMLFLNSINAESDAEGITDSNMMLSLTDSDIEISPEAIRSFLTSINWDRLASMYLPSRSGAECEARWLNCEDPMTNHNAWDAAEDKKLLFVVQEKGIYNWIDISLALGTHRTPFQCLSRYQRSLNPYILNKDWTAEEDAKLRAAVESYGNDWQVVASCVEGRTGAQCLNRWSHSLNPLRKKVGRWSVDEDKRLKVAVLLFDAKNWHKIAQFAPGRTQVQCRERWLNCLNPSLNLKPWTAEEDEKLLAAISEHGYCWSKVASCVLPRTDNQCRRRWKVLLPGEVPLQQAARQMKKIIFISNFVNRTSERPAIDLNDFMPPVTPVTGENSDGANNQEKELSDSRSKQPKTKSTKATRRNRTKKRLVDGSANIVPSELAILPSFTPTCGQNERVIDSGKRKTRKTLEGKPRKRRTRDISRENDPACLATDQHDYNTEFCAAEKTMNESENNQSTMRTDPIATASGCSMGLELMDLDDLIPDDLPLACFANSYIGDGRSNKRRKTRKTLEGKPRKRRTRDISRENDPACLATDQHDYNTQFCAAEKTMNEGENNQSTLRTDPIATASGCSMGLEPMDLDDLIPDDLPLAFFANSYIGDDRSNRRRKNALRDTVSKSSEVESRKSHLDHMPDSSVKEIHANGRNMRTEAKNNSKRLSDGRIKTSRAKTKWSGKEILKDALNIEPVDKMIRRQAEDVSLADDDASNYVVESNYGNAPGLSKETEIDYIGVAKATTAVEDGNEDDDSAILATLYHGDNRSSKRRKNEQRDTASKSSEEEDDDSVILATLYHGDNRSNKRRKNEQRDTASKSSEVESRKSYVRRGDQMPDSSVKENHANVWNTDTEAKNNMKRLSDWKIKRSRSKPKCSGKEIFKDALNVEPVDKMIRRQAEDVSLADDDSSNYDVESSYGIAPGLSKETEIDYNGDAKAVTAVADCNEDDDSVVLATFYKKVQRKHTSENNRTTN